MSSLRALECVVSVADSGSITQAAWLLHAAATGATISSSLDNYTVTYRAGSGEGNEPLITFRTEEEGTSGSPYLHHYTLRDAGPITPQGETCSWPDPSDHRTVECWLREAAGGDFQP